MANTRGKQRKAGSPRSELLSRIPQACRDETKAVEFFEEQRWGDTPACPRCGDTKVRQLKANDGSRNARFLWRCGGCKQQFTVRVGTILEDSPIPMRHWAYAFWAACASKKGVSAKQIERTTGLSYKSALYLMHRIRWAMAPVNESEPMLGVGGGTVEFDETYVGGRPRRIHMPPKGTVRKGKGYDFSKRKTPVVAGVERDGRVKGRVVEYAKGTVLQDHVREMVDTSAHFMTDEYVGYRKVGKEYASHQRVHHSDGEYVRGDVTTNRIEGFFAGLKRQIKGTHHSVSRKHLQRYVSEIEFKYNTRQVDDGERTRLAIRGGDGKRLMYRDQLKRAEGE
jgi:transposase-like protein